MEMASLMDVMFLVLVFFIYCIFNMTVHRGMKVDLPSAEGAAELGERIVITIAPDDSLQFNGIASSKEDVLARLDELRRVKMDLPVLIAGDRKASLGTGIELLAALKSAGIGNAKFQVKGDGPK